MAEREKSVSSMLRVAVALPVEGSFSYWVPERLSGLVKPGCRVLVPFNNRNVTGYVLDQKGMAPHRKLKNIIDILDIEPVFLPHMIPFFEWIAEYYLCPIGMVIRAAVPEAHYKIAAITPKGLAALNGRLFASEEIDILSWVKANPEKRLKWPLRKIYPLKEKGWLTLQTRSLKPASRPKQLRFVMPEEDVDLRGVSPPPLRHKLNHYQKRVLSDIVNHLDQGAFSSVLLHGVTGSGKTEVYYRAVEHTLRSGRRAILMAPEISLAMYLEGFFKMRLGDRIAIYHSGLTRREKAYQWSRMMNGEADLVIGARSAIFSPLANLGLIIVDEEHDTAYAQDQDAHGGPRYHARDVAVVRAKQGKAVVILGSGTPSVQSFESSVLGRYTRLEMPYRVEKRSFPEMKIVDMKVESNRRGKGMISPTLEKHLEQNLMAGNQAILFLNRRGYHRVYLCRSCGETARCPNCDVSLTHHQKADCLACHYCGFRCGTQVTCNACGHSRLKGYGFGTERLENEIQSLFPDARVSRMDTDITGRKGAASGILRAFSQRNIDILVGTQMITKGYDFPGVTLVGIISADLSLGFPDFRAAERTFQLLSQVSGRAGRGHAEGTVIVQTFNPDHYAIRAAINHDYLSFFEREKALRRQLNYPPFSHLVCLRLQGNDKAKTEACVHEIHHVLKRVLSMWPENGRDIQVLGPVESPISRIKGKYRWQILIKCRRSSLRHFFLRELEPRTRKALQVNGVQLIQDVDPYQMS